MGWKDWLWSSPAPSKKETSSPPQASFTAPESQPTEPAPAPQAAPRQLTPDEQAEQEFRDLLKELDQPPTTFSTLPADSPDPRGAGDPKSSSSILSRALSDPDALHPAALLPTEMSCRAAFDAAFYCQSMGGQFNNLYRYGGMRNCSEMWSNFWFCMRTNNGGLEDAERVRQIQKHYWDREEKYRTGPSSEDIWPLRAKKVDGAFDGDYEALEKGEDVR